MCFLLKESDLHRGLGNEKSTTMCDCSRAACRPGLRADLSCGPSMRSPPPDVERDLADGTEWSAPKYESLTGYGRKTSQVPTTTPSSSQISASMGLW